MRKRTAHDERLVYFMPTAAGPCRFGQYSEFLKMLAAKHRMENTAIYSPDGENSYADLGVADLSKALWQAIIAADVFQETYSVLLTNAVDAEAALERFGDAWSRVIACIEKGFDVQRLDETMEAVARNLAGIRLRRTLEDTPFILLAGEIYVRNDDISRQHLVEELARQGFAVRVASVAEWIYYTDWCVLNNVNTTVSTWRDRLKIRLRARYMRSRQKRIRNILSRSGLCSTRCEDVGHILKHTVHLMKPEMTGEAILTIGTSLNEIIDHYCGAIAIGPFGCMPNRIAEAVLAREMTLEGKLATGSGAGRARRLIGRMDTLPFLAIESDGSCFPQIITARLEAFLLQAARLHELQKSENPKRSR